MTLDWCPEPWTNLISSVTFEHGGCKYKGTNGFLSWNPANGFHLEASVSVIEGRRPTTYAPRTPADAGSIDFELDLPSGIKVVGSGVSFPNEDVLFMANRFVVAAKALEFEVADVQTSATPEWSAQATYALPDGIVLPNVIERITTFPRTGLQLSRRCLGLESDPLDGVTLVACTTDAGLLEVRWTLPKSTWSEAEAWGIADGLRLALSLVYGHTMPLLKHTMASETHERTEIRARADSRWIWFLHAAADMKAHAEILQVLSTHLAKGKPHAETCRNIIA